MKSSSFTVLITLLVAALACNLGGAAAPTATATPAAPLRTPEPTVTLPAPAATAPQPTSPPPPSATPPTVPEAPLSPTGPWLLIITKGGGSLWAVNPDGSGLTQVANEPIFSVAVSPSGGQVAYVTATIADPPQESALKILKLSTDETQTITPLTTTATEPDLSANFGDPAFEAASAVTSVGSLAWSPDGRRLAFVGAQDGPTADLYVYSLDDGRITRLTRWPTQALSPNWSPDGNYIVQTGTNSVTMGIPYRIDGIWAARADGSAVTRLDIPSGYHGVIGWIGPETFLIYEFSFEDGNRNLRAVDISSGAVRTLLPGSFHSLALDPAGGSVMVWSPPDQAVYLIPRGKTAADSADLVGGNDIHGVSWSPEARLYLVSRDSGAVTVTPEGKVAVFTSVPGEDAVAAPDGQTWAWAGNGVLVGPLDTRPRQVFAGNAYLPTWAPDGQTLLFFGDDGLYVAPSPDYRSVRVAFDRQVTGTAWGSP